MSFTSLVIKGGATLLSHKVGRNEPCPCGTGRKYKHCCWDKQLDWLRNEAGKVVRRVPVPPDLAAVLEERAQDYIHRHGHEPDPDSPLIPGLAAASDEELTNGMAAIMEQQGFDAAAMYAFRKTGLIVTEMNQGLLPNKDLEEWFAAVDEYRRQHGD